MYKVQLKILLEINAGTIRKTCAYIDLDKEIRGQLQNVRLDNNK